MTSHIIIRRYPYEEPYHIHIEITASNGNFTASTDIYCNVEDLRVIGESLISFPQKIGDIYVYEYGSEDPTERWYRYFSLKAYTIDQSGHSALQIKINKNEKEPNEGIATFSIKSDPSEINILGKLFVEFSNLKHLELHWGIDNCLFEKHIY